MDKDLVITREFDAPRELVFKAWTDSELGRQWYGPEHFTAPHYSIDLRPGGAYRYCMRSPEGQEFWGGGVVQEVVVPERLVMTDYFTDAEGNKVSPAQMGMTVDFPDETLLTVVFEELAGNRTKLTLLSNVSAALAKEIGATEGWSTSLDKLERLLDAEMKTAA